MAFSTTGLLGRGVKRFYRFSPAENVSALRRRLSSHPPPPAVERDRNKVLPDIVADPALLDIALRGLHGGQDVIVVGAASWADVVQGTLRRKNIAARSLDWRWDPNVDLGPVSENSVVLVTDTPLTGDQWQQFTALKQRCGARVELLYTLLLPATALMLAQRKLDYYLKSVAEIAPFLLGTSYFGPFEELNALFPLRGKRVIEFGPFDGCQTAGLVNLGAHVTAIEARAENVIKTLVAGQVLGWDRVRVVMDDLHNVDAARYGRFDLAFAHGVYYHSIAPFLFLENLCTLSSHVFIGGFCATDALPPEPYTTIEHAGHRYRVKTYREAEGYTAGVNNVAYYLEKSDLIAFFERKGFDVTVMADQTRTVTAGCYLRLFCAKRS